MINAKNLMTKRIEIDPELKTKFWDGRMNRFIRYYFYLQKGLALFNELRYVVMVCLALYAFMKFDNIFLLPLMFFAFIPPLLVAGYISVHYMDKVMEFLNVRYATHYSHYNVELQEKQLKLQEEILTFLKERGKK
jgi:hypothetical protein